MQRNEYLNNPINAFTLIKHMTIDLKIMRQQFPDKFKKAFDNANAKDFQLTETDLTEAVEGLLRLQSLYKFKTVDFANGIIDGVKTRNEMTTHDLFVLGAEAFKIPNQDYFSQEYFKLAWERINLGLYSEKEVDDRFLMLRLVTSYNRTGYFQKAINTLDTIVRKYPEYKQLIEVKSLFETYLNKFGTSKMFLKDPYLDSFIKDGKFSAEKEETIYSQACRGSLKRLPRDDARLKCGFVYLYKRPFTRLAQFKIEEVNMNPYVVVYHDVLSVQEMDYLMSVSKSKVRWAVKNSDSDEKLVKSAWLSREKNHDVVKRISQRIEVSFSV